MARVVSAYFPMWSVDLLRRRFRRRRRSDAREAEVSGGRRPHLLVEDAVGGRRLVAARCAQSAAAGVRVGMNMADARALLPPDGVIVRPDDPARRTRALEAMAQWSLRFTPTVAPDHPDGLLLDVTGCTRLYGGEEAIVRTVRTGFESLGFRVRVALASTPGCAWALARHGMNDSTIIPAGGERAALGELPVEALRLESHASERLRDVGVERVSDLLRLSRRSIPARFGSDVLLRLDQAMGGAFESVSGVRPTSPVEAERVFGGPTTRVEAIEACVSELLGRVAEMLTARERGVTTLEVELRRVDAASERLPLRLSYPCRDAGRLMSLLRPRLERVCLGYGVESVIVRAVRTERLRHEQHRAWAPENEAMRRDAERRLGVLLDALLDRLGDGGVWRASARASHLPERAWRRVDAREASSSADAMAVDRPSHVVERPIPVQVMIMTPDGPVILVDGPGGSRRIVTTIGPERIGPEWWTAPPGTSGRDFFKVQDEEGRWLWLFRALRSGAWFVAGEWS